MRHDPAQVLARAPEIFVVCELAVHCSATLPFDGDTSMYNGINADTTRKVQTLETDNVHI